MITRVVLLCINGVIMNDITGYTTNEIGLHLHVEDTGKDWNKSLPLYLKATYRLQEASLEAAKVMLVQLSTPENEPAISQVKKHAQIIREIVKLPVIFVFKNLEAYKRKRLVSHKLNFIVPYKQLYIPEMAMAFNESRLSSKTKHQELTPMAQVLVIYWLLSADNSSPLENTPFKDVATYFKVNAMAITRAVENLAALDLCEIHDGRPKYFNFKHDKRETWRLIKEQKIGINPVLNRVYTDEQPPHNHWLHTNINALAFYTEVNPGKVQTLAIDKVEYQQFKKTNSWPEENEYEGEYMVEVWKYNPALITKTPDRFDSNVDPLSLCFCFMDDNDERIEEALDQIERKYIW